MATATITVNVDAREVDGGSALDYLVLDDVRSAANSDLSDINYNAVRMTNREAKQYVFKNTSYVDLTDARLFLTNNANGQILNTKFEGRIRVGSDDDPLGFCEIHWGDKDNGGYDVNRFPVFGTTDNAYVSCPGVENRIKLMSHLDGPTSSGVAEPAGKNAVTIQNNNSQSTIRISLLGASHTYGLNYVLPNSGSFKPNGTILCWWQVGSNVTVRDLEFRDGYVDWRPIGNWATPTRGIFVSETWMKFLGSANFTHAAPLIFGNENDPFEIVVGNSGQVGSYILHGIYSTGVEGRIVYNNFKGLTWADQMAVYGNGDKIRIENHLQLDYTVINSLAQPIENAIITTYKKDPVYNATNDLVDYSGIENSFETTTDVDGQGNIGNGDGTNTGNVCCEAFCRRDGGGNVDGAYANKDHALADYASNTAVYYTITKWGKTPIIRSLYTCKLSGESGEGKQSLGVIQLETALSLVSATINDVPTAITDAESFYDVAYKYAVENKIAIFCEREGDTVVTTNDIVFDNGATELLTFSNNTITVKTNVWNSSITAPTVYMLTPMDLDTQKLDTELHFDCLSDVAVTFSKVTVTGDVLNDSTSYTVSIDLVDGSTASTTEPGTGIGEVNLARPVAFSFTIKPSITNYEWRIYEVTAVGSLTGAVEVDGEELASADNQSYTYDYTIDKVLAVQLIPTTDAVGNDDFEEVVAYYPISDILQNVTIDTTIDTNN